VSETISCPACGSANEAGRKFCGECGTTLAQTCPSCGTPNAPSVKFCGECGTALGASAAPAAVAPVTTAPAAERRLVSVLFADLVGFTTLSESRDSEEVRELLSRYFDTSRRLIELYGGTVEKFIGDAVMAVWGTPTATEDDAERAVRAGLDLVAAVSALGDEIGAPELAARAGVLTGEAAVTLGAEGQGMVAGDLVNTASRIQSAAEPGTVFVGEATKRASEASIAYASAGTHALKGKDEPVPLWRALRVTAGRGGALKSAGLEPPFVGRDRELRLVKEIFHATADEQRAHLVSVIGIAGIGKSRLGWEFFKYMDGLEEVVWWHRGRCLAYGEGVAFWALAEMVRMRAGIVEGETGDTAREKVGATLDTFVVDEEERRFVEPRMLHLLGLDDGPARAKEELFGAWRLFFERMADQGPVALLFEDLQWADSALVEFVGHLLEWSRNHPIFVFCLARPELQTRHPEFGHGSHQTTLSLSPLPEPAMQELLDGFVPGLPPDLRRRILDRSEGVPLYAVETVRMLLDRGLLTEADGVYRLTGEVTELEVPETLQGLIAARLDGLSADERRLLQDGAVLGKTFTKDSLAELSGLPESDLDGLLSALVRKEVLGVQADPRSPERGQYGFLQDLVRRVAYDTLARRDRKARHLAAAAQLERSYGAAEAEIVEVVAAHYVAAYEAQPDADDAGEVRAKARELLSRAGERAGSLGACGEALRALEQAAGLTDDAVERGLLLERAAFWASIDAQWDAAERLVTESHRLLTDAGDRYAAARVAARLGGLETGLGRAEQGLRRLEEAYAVVADGAPDEDVVEVASRLANTYSFAGDVERGSEMTELTLRISQALRLPRPLVRGLGTRAMLARLAGRPEEELAWLRHLIRYALDHDEVRDFAAQGYSNLSDSCLMGDRYGEALEALAEAERLARRDGDRQSLYFVFSERSYALTMTGRWDEAVAASSEIPDEQLSTNSSYLSLLTGVLEIHLHRGRLDDARSLLSTMAFIEEAIVIQDRAVYMAARAALSFAEGNYDDALEAGSEVATISVVPQAEKQGLTWAVEAALALGRRDRADELLRLVDETPPGLRPPFLEAQVQRFRARMAGDPESFKAAAAGFREYGVPFWLAVTLLEHGELTGESALLDEAREIFERLQARPWIERLDSVASTRPEVPA
jgi:class 3 adenylate cyclase/tetratricopeptide (TPR) repeat protein